jgi:hypothetical protein
MISMLTAEAAIHRTRRDLTLGLALKALFPLALVGCFLVGPEPLRLAMLFGVIGGWVALGLSSVRRAQLAAMSPGLIAAGRFEEAEQQIDEAIRSFSPFSSAKLRPLHHLALLRHAQRRWKETALLCREFLGHRPGAVKGLSNPARLILTDALLEMGDVRGAYDAIASLYRERLSLAEVLHLMLLQLDYSARIAAWKSMLESVANKVQMAELMPADGAARAQALLALAAMKLGRDDWAQWLGARARLLADPVQLMDQRPILRELWKSDALGAEHG